MSLSATCHLCGNRQFDWTLKRSSVSVGRLQNWQAQACEDCTAKLEDAVWTAIKQLLKPLGSQS